MKVRMVSPGYGWCDQCLLWWPVTAQEWWRGVFCPECGERLTEKSRFRSFLDIREAE